MTRTALGVLVLILILGFGATQTAAQSPAVQQVDFALAPGQAVVLGEYTLQYQGMAGVFPAYDLYFGASLVARFPSTPPPPNVSRYVYENVVIQTSGVAPEGSIATGKLIIQ